jgi:hypothetical protein
MFILSIEIDKRVCKISHKCQTHFLMYVARLSNLEPFQIYSTTPIVRDLYCVSRSAHLCQGIILLRRNHSSTGCGNLNLYIFKLS